MPYRVNGQYILEGLASSFMVIFIKEFKSKVTNNIDFLLYLSSHWVD